MVEFEREMCLMQINNKQLVHVHAKGSWERGVCLHDVTFLNISKSAAIWQAGNGDAEEDGEG